MVVVQMDYMDYKEEMFQEHYYLVSMAYGSLVVEQIGKLVELVVDNGLT